MSIPEPSDGVLPIELSNARTEAMKAHMDKTAAVAQLFPEASNLKELQQAINEHFGFSGASVTPEQMEDGKRYAVTVEGRWNAPGVVSHNPEYGWLDLPNGELEDFHLPYASRIVEIGGEK